MEYMSKNQREPFEALGARLKHLREQWKQSISEVSGTLEIDEKVLRDIESGKTMPPDSVLDMFINHFLLTEEQAEDLRELASQHKEQVSDSLMNGLEDMLMKQIVMYLPGDNRISYTDQMQATVNKNGVVLQFMQSNLTPDQQSITVNRVGMSREHAERMLEVLRTTLDQHDRSQGTKHLPAPKKDNR